jgi:LacI family transcriptional regulator
MAELLTLSRKPTAIVAANDLTAIGALRTIQKRNLSVPEDFSLIGFDDIEIADILHPPLTTLRLSRSELASLFFKSLEELRSQHHPQGEQYSIKPSLVVRESTAAVRPG